MKKYYTRACNFYYGSVSKEKIKKKLALPLNGNNLISFDKIELLTRKSKKIFPLKKINLLPKKIKNKINKDIKSITKKKIFHNLNFINSTIIMGVLNLTPDSFSDGGKYLNRKSALRKFKILINQGSEIIDIGGESTRPGSKSVKEEVELKRLTPILKIIKRYNCFVSLDTRKSLVMEKGIKSGIKLINDVSGLNYDLNTMKILKKNKIPFVLHHMLGTPDTMQKNPKYRNVLLDIYDFFEKKLKDIKSFGIKHNNIILDPGIGFGKNLKHNITLIDKISIFHSLGLPIMLGISRKKFIKDLSKKNDSKERIGGTVASSLYSMMQGVQILRVHNVNEVKQAIKVFRKLKFK
jgi:dihydropteroate synthase